MFGTEKECFRVCLEPAKSHTNPLSEVLLRKESSFVHGTVCTFSSTLCSNALSVAVL